MKKRLLEEIMQVKAVEYNCDASLFNESENLILIDERAGFKMITFGKNVVVVTNEDVYQKVKFFFDNTEGIFCFDAPQLCNLNQVLNKYKYALGEIHDFYIPAKVFATKLKSNRDLEIKKVNKREYAWIDDIETFTNAVCTGGSFSLNEFAYDAMKGEKVVAIAGVSSNTDRLWWIGVDSIEGYRQKGLASYLVNLVARDTLDLKKIPVYPTWFSNIGSRITAINAGFKPGFVEIMACRQ